MVGIELIVIIHCPGLNSLNERTVHVPAVNTLSYEMYARYVYNKYARIASSLFNPICTLHDR